MGLNGLLRRSRESFVVWAFRREDASERRAKGLGEEGSEELVGRGDWRAWRKVVRRVRMLWRECWRESSGFVEAWGAILARTEC